MVYYTYSIDILPTPEVIHESNIGISTRLKRIYSPIFARYSELHMSVAGIVGIHYYRRAFFLQYENAVTSTILGHSMYIKYMVVAVTSIAVWEETK